MKTTGHFRSFDSAVFFGEHLCFSDMKPHDAAHLASKLNETVGRFAEGVEVIPPTCKTFVLKEAAA